jgi:hypothetical protein
MVTSTSVFSNPSYLRDARQEALTKITIGTTFAAIGLLLQLGHVLAQIHHAPPAAKQALSSSSLLFIFAGLLTHISAQCTLAATSNNHRVRHYSLPENV